MALNNDNNDKSCKCTTPEYEIVLNEQGPQGRQGNKGDAGFTPIISVKDNTDSNYTLNILTQDGQITTPNLKANLPAGGATGQVLTKNSGEQDDCSWQNLPNATTETEGIARLATETDFTTTEDSSVSETSIVTPALFNNELTKQVQNFIVAGDNITTSVDGEGKVTINATAEPYSLPQANATTLGGVKVNPKTEEDTQPVNIDAATGLLYTKAGSGSELVPATDTTLGGIIVGDGLKVDSEGLTSLDLNTESPLQFQGSIPSNPYILTPESGSNISFQDLDVIAFNPANGHNLLQDVNNISNNPSVGTAYTLAVKNRTNGVLDWKNNILEIPLNQPNDGQFICSVGLNRDYNTTNNHDRSIGLIWANKDNEGNITPLYYVTTEVPINFGSVSEKSCVYKFLDNGTEGNTSTTNYQVSCIHNYNSAYSSANGACLMVVNQCIYTENTNTYGFYTSGNTPCWNSVQFPEVKKDNPETWTKWQFSDQKPINWYQTCTNAENISEDKLVNCAFYVTINNNDEISWINAKYPLLAKFTGNLSRIDGENFVEVINQMDQHYVEVTPASGTPTLSLNYDNSTIKVNEEGQLYANVSIPSNITTQGNTFNGASQLVQLDSSGKLPALDGSQLTNLPSGNQEIESIPAGSDFNNFLSTGIYFWAASGVISNNPNTNMRGYLQVFRFQDNKSLPVVQLYYTCDSTTTNPPEVWIRYCVNGNGGYAWTAWTEITNQSGSSEPPANMVTTDTEQTITGTKTFNNLLVNATGTGQRNVIRANISTPSSGYSIINALGIYTNPDTYENTLKIGPTFDKVNIGSKLSITNEEFTFNNQAVVTTNNTIPLTIWRGTQSEYDGIAAKDENTMYIITE